MDPSDKSSLAHKHAWAKFAPHEAFTTLPAAQLVKYARVREGQGVLDVACGTGVVAVTAARLGASVTGLDLTPELLDRARENSAIAQVEIDWYEGDVESLPFGDAEFDVVLSQFGHIFAPRPAVAVAEMLRVLRPGGTIAFSTWPPEMYVGRTFALASSYLPPPPPGVSPPREWGDPAIVLERLGGGVKNVRFKRGVMRTPSLSPQHTRTTFERTVVPGIELVEALSATDPVKLEQFRRAYEALIAEQVEDNVIRQDYLMTRATKI